MKEKNAGFGASWGIALFGLMLLVAGFLPDSVFSGFLLSLSYSGSVSGTKLAIAEYLARFCLVALGVLIGLHAIPRVRGLWASKFLPYPPPEQSLEDCWPGNGDLWVWIGLSALMVLLSLPIFMALVADPHRLRSLLQEDSGFEAARLIRTSSRPDCRRWHRSTL